MGPNLGYIVEEGIQLKSKIQGVGFRPLVYVDKKTNQTIVTLGGDSFEPKEHYKRALEEYIKSLGVEPDIIVTDTNPNFISSICGKDYAEQHNIQLLKVQNNHGQIAAVIDEYQFDEPVLGICFDSSNYGVDDKMWGGEFMLTDGAEAKRLAHLAYAPLPGGMRAAKEPWRQALWYLRCLYDNKVVLPEKYAGWYDNLPVESEQIDNMIIQNRAMLVTSSAASFFDSLGALLGLGNTCYYEGQIAGTLNNLAGHERGKLHDFNYINDVLDFFPLAETILKRYTKGVNRKVLAASLFRTVGFGLTEVAQNLCYTYGVKKVVLCGNLFQNRRLLEEIYRFWPEGEVYLPIKTPLHAGSLQEGQLWIARKKLAL